MKTPLMSNRLFDQLKWVAQIFLPALGAFYFGLGELWHLPHVAQTVGTLTLLDTFLGVLLGIAANKYAASDARYDGTMHVHEALDGTKTAALVLKNYADPSDIVNQNEVTFKVNPVRAPGDPEAPVTQ